MSIQSEINRILSNVADSFSAVAGKGGTFPTLHNSDNLAGAIETIPTGKQEETFTATPSLSQQTITPTSGKVFSSGIVNPITAQLLESLDADFVAENIKKNVDLFGRIGTFAGGGATNIKTFDITLPTKITERRKIYENDPDVKAQIGNENLIILAYATSVSTDKTYGVFFGASANKPLCHPGTTSYYGYFNCYNSNGTTASARVGGGLTTDNESKLAIVADSNGNIYLNPFNSYTFSACSYRFIVLW